MAGLNLCGFGANSSRLVKNAVRLEFPILSLHPGLRPRGVEPDVWGRRVAGGGAAAIVEEAGRPPGRLTGGTPCASGGWRCRCGGRPAGYWDHGAPTPRPTANRLRIGRSSAAYWAFIGRLLAVKAHAIALRTSRSRLRTRSCGATSRSRTIMFSPVSPDGSPARAYAVVRRCSGSKVLKFRIISSDKSADLDESSRCCCRTARR